MPKEITNNVQFRIPHSALRILRRGCGDWQDFSIKEIPAIEAKVANKRGHLFTTHVCAVVWKGPAQHFCINSTERQTVDVDAC